jgi:ribosomal protein S18 acetylase RimI-like enzyme
LEGFFVYQKGDIMAGRVIIRKAVREDIPTILELWKELMDFNKKYDRIFSRSATGHEGFAKLLTGHISSDTSCVFVAEAGKDIIGYCLAIIEKYPPFFESKGRGLVQNVAVTQQYRRRGIGKQLLKKTQSWFSKKGVQRVEAYVAKTNKISKGFWAKMGFTPFVETVFREIERDEN